MKNIIKEWKLRNFTVRVEALPDSDLDLSFEDTGEVARQLDAGELIAFCAKASVWLNGIELATNYLGSCIHRSYADFNDHVEAHAQGCGSYFKDMVKSTIAEARETLTQMQSIHIRT